MEPFADPVPPGSGEPDREPVRERTYAVVFVLPDGNPQVDSRWGDIAKALDQRDVVKAELAEAGYQRSFVGVIDEDDEGRGYLTEEDINVWKA